MPRRILARNSIRWRAAFLTSALVAVALASFLALTVRLVSADLLNSAKTRSEAAAHQLAATQAGGQGGPQGSRRFQEFAANPAVQRFLQAPSDATKPEALGVLERLAAVGRQAAALWNAEGRLVLVAGSEADESFADERTPAGPGPGPLIQRDGRVYLRTYGLVRDSDGTLLGHVATSRVIDSSSSTNLIGNLAGQSARVFIGNQSGDVWTDLSHAVTLPSLDLATSTPREFDGPGGERLIGTPANISNTPWVLVFAFPRSEVMAPVWRLVKHLTGVGAIFIVMVTIGAALFSARVTRPLDHLTNAAQAISAGDYTQRVEASGQDEVARLSEAFNAMALQVEKARADLQARAVELAASREEARRANEAKDEFLAVLSHELRSPLNAMLGWCQLLRLNAVPAHSVPHAIEVIDRNARAQLRLVDDLLDVSRIIVGRFFVDFHAVDPATIVQTAVESIRPAAAEKRVQVHAELASVGSLRGDAVRLQQAVSNLLANALKFTSAGGRIHVSLSSKAGGAEIVVRDTGEGIAPDVLPHIFNRLHQERSDVPRPQSGLGLGLAIVRQVVELHGGTVSAESAGKGAGATFRITLPGTGVPSTNAPGDKPLESQAPANECSVRGIKCLIVDDSEDAREMVAALLSTCGAEVTTADSADAAVAALQQKLPDVILSDLAMPGRSGLELIQEIRRWPAEEGGRIPAVALTAYAAPEDRHRSLRAGFDVHLVKPVDANELIETVTKLVRANP